MVEDAGEGDGVELLTSCYRSALDLARRMNLNSLAVPAVGAGTNGFPLPVAAEVALGELFRHLKTPGAPRQVSVVLFDKTTLNGYRSVLSQMRQGV